MSTPLSGSSSYATVPQFLDRFDANYVADLLSDSSARTAAADLLTSPRLLAILQEASGIVESVCLVGGRYTKDDLAVLTGNSQMMLIGIVCGIAGGILLSRRPEKMLRLPTSVQLAQELLDKLAAGSVLFGLQEVRDATIPEVVRESNSELMQNRRLVTRAQRWLGYNSTRIPLD